MDRIESSLRWMLPIIEERELIYHVTGGFSAHLYGADRAVNDIDINLPHEDYLVLSAVLKPYVILGPQREKNSLWDMWLTEIQYQGQLFDLCSNLEPRVRHKETRKWVRIDADFTTDQVISWHGMKLRVQHPRDVAAYKSVISFEGDESKHLADARAALNWACVRNM